MCYQALVFALNARMNGTRPPALERTGIMEEIKISKGLLSHEENKEKGVFNLEEEGRT